MTRAQIARDQSMARTLQALAQPGRVLLLLAGAGHVDRQLGVPQHLPAGFRVKVLRLQAGDGEEAAGASAKADMTWRTEAAPPKDYCAELQARPAAMRAD
jgi:uncharacterized iron-regulated protein